MLLNTLDAGLGPRCIGGVLESLGTRPPRPIPHRDREDILDLAEGTTPWLPGNEHLILQSSVRPTVSPSVYLGVKHHAPISSSSGKSQCSSTDHTLHAGFSRVALHPTTRWSPPFGQKTCLTHLCSPEPCAGKKCGLKKSLLTNVWPLGSQDQLGQSDRRWGQLTQQQGSLCSVPAPEWHPAPRWTLVGWSLPLSGPKSPPTLNLHLPTSPEYICLSKRPQVTERLSDQVLSHPQQHHATRVSPGSTPGQGPSLHSRASLQRSSPPALRSPGSRFSYDSVSVRPTHATPSSRPALGSPTTFVMVAPQAAAPIPLLHLETMPLKLKF